MFAERLETEVMQIQVCTPEMLDEWVVLRSQLWPGEIPSLRPGALDMLENPDQVAFLAQDDKGQAIAFAEAAIRRDYVNGCETSPVGFLEGIYVVPAWRRQGVARALCDIIAEWVKEEGCREFASDALLENEKSHTMHKALGFLETERVVYFRKKLR